MDKNNPLTYFLINSLFNQYFVVGIKARINEIKLILYPFTHMRDKVHQENYSRILKNNLGDHYADMLAHLDALKDFYEMWYFPADPVDAWEHFLKFIKNQKIFTTDLIKTAVGYNKKTLKMIIWDKSNQLENMLKFEQSYKDFLTRANLNDGEFEDKEDLDIYGNIDFDLNID